MRPKHLFLWLILSLIGYQQLRAQCGTVVGDTVYVTSTSNVAGSLRQAILCVNNPTNSIRYIHFDIGDPGVITITPTLAAPLPNITKNGVVIDARTEPDWFLGKVVVDGGAFASTRHGFNLQGNDISVYGLTITGYTNAATGGAIFLLGNGAFIAENALIGNRYGIQTASPSSFTASDNFIGVDPVTDDRAGNSMAGINILTSALGSFSIENNIIAHNPTGILAASSAVEVLAIENSIYCNSTKGIERSGFTVGGFALTSASTSTVSGTGPNGATIEVYLNNIIGCDPVNPPCQGKTFLGATTVSGGTWTLNLQAGDVQTGDEVTATASVGGDNTSEFLSCFTVSCATGDVSFTDVMDSCPNGSTGSATASVSIAGDFTYNWSDGQTGETATDLAPGSYSVTATVVGGCAYIGTIAIGALPRPEAFPISNSPICIGQTLLLESGGFGGTPSYTYDWDGPDGFTSDEANPTIPDVQLAADGLYTLTITDSNGCEDIARTEVTVNEGPSFDLVVQDVSCNGANDGGIDLIPLAIAPGHTYNWSNGDTTEDLVDVGPGTYIVEVTDGNGCTASDSRTITEPPPLVLDNLQPTAPSMVGGSDGSLSFDLSGGTPPYAYTWTGPVNGSDNLATAGTATINGLLSGNYDLAISDENGCRTNQAFTIPSLNCDFVLSDSLVTAVSCAGGNDGQITLTLAGGTPPINYNWSNGATTEDITDLTAGPYALTATDANGCQVLFQTIVTAPSALLLDNLQPTAPTMVGGNDGSLTLDLSGGTPPYAYTWTGPVNGSDNQAMAGTVTINNLSPGNYNLVVTGVNNCSASQAFTIPAVNCDLVLSDSLVTAVSCAGANDGQIALTFTGGALPISYNWSNGATTEDLTNLTVGPYTLTATDASGCEVLFQTVVPEPVALQLSNLQPTAPSAEGGTDGSLNFDLSGGTAPYAYIWTGPINGSDNQAMAGTATITDLVAGSYNLVVTDANSCTASATFIIPRGGCNLTIVELSTNPESCPGAADGQISLTLANGTPPYTYAWMMDTNNEGGDGTVIDGLSAGDYNILITDQLLCTVTTTATLTTNILPPPSNTTSTSCDQGDGTAVFDLMALGTNISPDPNLMIVWYSDATGTLLITNTNAYESMGGTVYAATSDGSCQSTLTAIQLQVLPSTNPACNGSGGECTTFAGDFTTTPTATVCNIFTAVNEYNDNAVLDANDSLVFVLHTQSGSNLGQILIVSEDAEVAFSPSNMQYGVTYYLSAVAGNQTANGVDFMDPCLSVAAGQAVVFVESLSGVLNFIQGENVLCQGEDLWLSTNVLTGFTLSYHWLTPNGDTIVTTEANLLIEELQTSDAGDYYVFVRDEACLFDQTGPFALTVLGLPPDERIDAGQDTVVCTSQFTLNAFPITQGSGSWTSPTGARINNPNAATTIADGLQLGPNRFVWTVQTSDCGPIGSDTITVILADGLNAMDDAFTLELANTEIFMDVLKNDGLVEGVAYTLRALTQPAFGTLQTLDNGFQYFEVDGRRGTVMFEYEICYENGSCAQSCATATVVIDVLNLPFLPEGFTPNDDGRNDELQVLGYSGGGDVSMKIQITNRWGDVVYEAADYLQELPWDGRLNNKGKLLPEGTYYAWMEIQVDGAVHQRTQAVYLIH